MTTEAHSVEIRSRGSWLRLVSGLVVVFVLFHWSALGCVRRFAVADAVRPASG